MGWFLFVLLLLAVAFGVAGAVIKATAFIALTIIAIVAVLILAAVLAFRYAWWRAVRNLDRSDRPARTRTLPRRDDRY